MPGFDGNVIWGGNLDFTDPTGVNFDHPGGFTAAGDLAIGTGTAVVKLLHLVQHQVNL